MYQNKAASFILINILALIALYLLIVNGAFSRGFHLLLLSLVVINLIQNKNKFFSATYLYSLLLLSTYLPLFLVELDYLPSIISENSIRNYILISKYYKIAMDYIIFGSLILTSYLPFSQTFVFYNRINFKGPNLHVTELIILTLSILVNRHSNIIFFENYAGDGYVEGQTFGGWSSFFIIFMAYYIFRSRLETKRNILFVLLIIAIWFMFGNRGEIFALAFFLLLNKFKGTKSIKWSKLLTWGSIVFIAFFSLGIIRGGKEFDFNNAIQSFIADFTAAPVVYTFMATVYHTDHEGFMYGTTFGDYILRTLPSFITPNRPQDLANMIHQKYSSTGGSHFFAETYLNFGVIGIFIQSHTFGLLFTLIEKKSSQSFYYQYIYVVLIFLATRTVWYGFITMYKVMVFLVVSFFFINITKEKYGSLKNRY